MVPTLINVLAHIQDRPQQQPSGAEILNHLCGLLRNRGKPLAFRAPYFRIRHSESFRRRPQQENSLAEQRQASERKDQRHRRELAFWR